jgi:hypothetical protein
MGFSADPGMQEDPTMLMMAFAKIMGQNRDEQTRKISDLVRFILSMYFCIC